MKPRPRTTAIKSLLLMVVLGSTTWVQAAPGVGVVTHLSGPLFVNKADGSMRVLSAQSAVEAGDTLATQGKGYAQIRFSDDSQLTLQPDTVVTLNTFSYDSSVPAQDEMLFTLKQGGVRSDVGKLGQRSIDRVTLVTPAARIALQSANAVVHYYPDNKTVAVGARLSQHLAMMGAGLEASAVKSDTAFGAFSAIVGARYAYRLASAAAWLESQTANPVSSVLALTSINTQPGLYVQVMDGQIVLANRGGIANFSAGQFGFTASVTQPPVLIPKAPGIQFTPPPAFSSSPASTSGSAAKAGSGGVDCVVR